MSVFCFSRKKLHPIIPAQLCNRICIFWKQSIWALCIPSASIFTLRLLWAWGLHWCCFVRNYNQGNYGCVYVCNVITHTWLNLHCPLSQQGGIIYVYISMSVCVHLCALVCVCTLACVFHCGLLDLLSTSSLVLLPSLPSAYFTLLLSAHTLRHIQDKRQMHTEARHRRTASLCWSHHTLDS